ncbi:hypothetical protein HDV01_006510 [Terramyces sp. JEL0728]|nr:hypothetical protein HDV01_006510 [Terramyces sp. JEL0728]
MGEYLFHDIIYDPNSKDNEIHSCNLLKEFSQDQDSLIAEQYILATIKHTLINQDQDLKYFLDFDLEVLGWEYEKYWNDYALLVRKEYSIYSHTDFVTENIIDNFAPLEKTLSPKKVLQELELSKNQPLEIQEKETDYKQVVDKLLKENKDLQQQLIEQPNIKLDLMEQITKLNQEMESLKLENQKQVELLENIKSIAKDYQSKHEKESEYSSKLESVIDLYEHFSQLTVSNIEKIERMDMNNHEQAYTCFTCKLKSRWF